MIADRRCEGCEYFDRGTAGPEIGDCHNPRSPRFQTRRDDTCSQFYPDTWDYDSRPQG